MSNIGFYEEDHVNFRKLVKTFIKQEVTPNFFTWTKNHALPKKIWAEAGKQGILGIEAGEEYGGFGIRDFRFRKILDEEFALANAFALALAFHLQDDLVLPYLLDLATEKQKTNLLPKLISGESVAAFATTEPEAGSDLRNIKTSAKKTSQGWTINGQKSFIGNALTCDFVLTLARTAAEGGKNGFSLFIVERERNGFKNGKQYEKMGLAASDTGEIFFDNVNIPADNLIGEIGKGLSYVRKHMVQARLGIAVASVAISKLAFKTALDFVKNRQAFQKKIIDFQNTRFVLADIATELDVLESYVDKMILDFNSQSLSEVSAAKVKLWASQTQKSIVDRCLQLQGGYGYMLESAIAQAYTASRVLTIFGGTSEIMKEIIGRDLS